MQKTYPSTAGSSSNIPKAIPIVTPIDESDQPICVTPVAESAGEKPKTSTAHVLLVGVVIMGIVFGSFAIVIAGTVYYFWPNSDERPILVRVAPGSYLITPDVNVKGWGGLTLTSNGIPVSKLGTRSDTPQSFHNFCGASKSLWVKRIVPGNAPEKRRFKDAIDAGWIRVQGDGADTYVLALAENKNDVYQNQAKLFLEVDDSTPGILGLDQKSVDKALSQLRSRPNTLAGVKKLDQFGGKLKNVFGENSDLLKRFNEKKQAVEAAMMANNRKPNNGVDQFLKKFKGELTDGNPHKALCWLTVLHGDRLTPQQIQNCRDQLGLKISSTYVGPQMSQQQAGSFWQTVERYKKVQKQILGPNVKLIRQQRFSLPNGGYREEKEFEYSWHIREQIEYRKRVTTHYRNSRGQQSPTAGLQAALNDADQ